MIFKVKESGTSKYTAFALEISTSGEDHPLIERYNTLHIALFHHFWYIRIPEIIKPQVKWVDLSQYDWATERDGKKGYWNAIRKSYGFSTFEGAIHFHYGIQPGSWSRDDPKNSDHTKVWNIPWLNKRFIRTSYYDVLNQSHVKTFRAKDRIGYLDPNGEHEFKETLRKMKVKFKDFDGEEITGSAIIEEREWRHGIGSFSWLSWFIKPTVHRNLWISFDKEVGYEKGSWKGGVMGQGIDMMKGESAQSAFNRYASGTDRYRNRGTMPRNFSNVEFSYE